MIRYLKNNEIDRDAWNTCVNQAPGALLYGYSWFLDMVADDWDGLVLDNYDAVMPLPKRRKWGIDYLYQPVLMQQGGIFSRVELGPDLVQKFIDSIPAHFRLIEINLNYSNSFSEIMLKKNRNLVLKLDKDSDTLMNNYSENTKRNIKKAQKKDYTFHYNFDMNNIMHLFNENKGAELKLNKYWKNRVTEITHALHHKGFGHTISLYNKKNQCIAGAFYAEYKQRVYFLFSGSGSEAKSSGAMHFLIHSLINKYAGSNFIFDFEGSNNDGLARFYSGFGAFEQNYPIIRINKLPYYMKLFKR